jgi:hypothetical protein
MARITFRVWITDGNYQHMYTNQYRLEILPLGTLENTMMRKWQQEGEDCVMISWRMGRARHVGRMGEIRKAYSVLVGQLSCKVPFWTPRLEHDGDIENNFEEIGWEGVE